MVDGDDVSLLVFRQSVTVVQRISSEFLNEIVLPVEHLYSTVVPDQELLCGEHKDVGRVVETAAWLDEAL